MKEKTYMTPSALVERTGVDKAIVYEVWGKLLGLPVAPCEAGRASCVIDELVRRGLMEQPPEEAPAVKPREGGGRALSGKYAKYGSKVSRTLSIPIRIYIYMEDHAPDGNVSGYINDLVIKEMEAKP